MRMSKSIVISICASYSECLTPTGCPRLVTDLWPISPDEIQNITNYTGDVDGEEFVNALSVVVSYMAQTENTHICCDVDYIEKNKTPIKKMTLSEIERKLGHKIEVIPEEGEQ